LKANWELSYGRRCKNVSAAEATEYIFGLHVIVNDVTAAEVLNEIMVTSRNGVGQRGTTPFGCVGPAITTDFDWAAARVINTPGRSGAAETTRYSDMIIPPAELVSFISHDMTLLPWRT